MQICKNLFYNFPHSVPSRASERRTSRGVSEQSHGGSKSQRSQRSKAEPGLATPGQDTPGVQPGYTDDTYGIPILELSSDSDVSVLIYSFKVILRFEYFLPVKSIYSVQLLYVNRIDTSNFIF